jgi:hypothetical protein
MNRYVLAVISPILFILIPAHASAQCPSPLPDRPSPGDLRECFKEISELRQAVAALKGGVTASVPINAVLAFDGPCPTGWVRFEPATARFVIGAGPPGDPRNRTWLRQLANGGFEPVGLTPKDLGEIGGEENHILSIAQLAAHSHNTFRATGNGDGLFPKAEVMGPKSQAINGATQETGGNVPHNNMPPFLALNFCKQTQ